MLSLLRPGPLFVLPQRTWAMTPIRFMAMVTSNCPICSFFSVIWLWTILLASCRLEALWLSQHSANSMMQLPRRWSEVFSIDQRSLMSYVARLMSYVATTKKCLPRIFVRHITFLSGYICSDTLSRHWHQPCSDTLSRHWNQLRTTLIVASRRARRCSIEISEFYPKKPGFYRNTELVKRIDFGLPPHIHSLSSRDALDTSIIGIIEP